MSLANKSSLSIRWAAIFLFVHSRDPEYGGELDELMAVRNPHRGDCGAWEQRRLTTISPLRGTTRECGRTEARPEGGRDALIAHWATWVSRTEGPEMMSVPPAAADARHVVRPHHKPSALSVQVTSDGTGKDRWGGVSPCHVYRNIRLAGPQKCWMHTRRSIDNIIIYYSNES